MNIEKNITYKNKISIIICCYNSQNFLETTLKSVEQQSYKEWEIIIINDGSSDNTDNIINEFIKLNKHLSIIYYKQENKGLAFSRNKAVEFAKYKWIAILDHDDIWQKNKLEIQNKEINTYSNSKLFFGDCYWLTENSILKKTRFENLKEKDFFNPYSLNLKKNYAYSNLIKYGCFITSSSVVFCKKAYLDVFGFNQSYKFITDYIFFNEVAKKYGLYCSNQVLCKYRLSANQATNQMRSTYYSEMFIFYKSIYMSKIISFKIKLIIFKRHIKLLIQYILKIS